MATRPARQPLTVMPRSGLPIAIHEVTVEVSTAAMAEVFVVIRIYMTSDGFSKLIVEPGLKPNQPSHRTNRPMTASDCLLYTSRIKPPFFCAYYLRTNFLFGG